MDLEDPVDQEALEDLADLDLEDHPEALLLALPVVPLEVLLAARTEHQAA